MKLALTYDDGPNPAATPALLDLFREHQVKATFFMIGKWALGCEELVQRVISEGHKLGNHTQTHPRLTEITPLEVLTEISECERSVTTASGLHSVSPKLFRPPFILHNEQTDQIVEKCKLTTVLYHAAAGDGGDPRTAEQIFEKITRELNDKSGIILMHDGSHLNVGADRTSTIAATYMLVTHYKEQGAQFVFPEELDAT